MSPHCKEHQNKKKMCVDRKSVEFVHFVLNVTKNLAKSIHIRKEMYLQQWICSAISQDSYFKSTLLLGFFTKWSVWVWHCFTSAFLFTVRDEDMYVNVILHSSCWMSAVQCISAIHHIPHWWVDKMSTSLWFEAVLFTSQVRNYPS